MSEDIKPIVMTSDYQQLRSPSTVQGYTGKDPLKLLKEYDVVAKYNELDEIVSLVNVFFSRRYWQAILRK